MSISYGSGGRQRPVDVSADDGEEIALNGVRLKQLRVERGLSVSEAARLVTLSREQVEQIENGGLGAFYGAKHKLLAARKYAEGFGITLEDILPQPPAPAAAVSAAVPAVETDEAPVAPQVEVETTSAKTVEPAPAPAAEILTAVPKIDELPAAPVPRVTSTDDIAPPSNISETTVKRLPVALVVGASLILVFSILRGLTPQQERSELPPEPVADATVASEPSVATTEDQAVPSDTTPTPEIVVPTSAAPASTQATAVAATPAPVATPSPATTTATTTTTTTTTPATTASAATPPVPDPAAIDACAVTAGPDTPRWAPAQGRNSSTRVFLTSAAPIDICVTDANGTSTPLRLKPGVMSSAAGKPPYVVRSERLSQAQIYLQGLKVRVPSSAVAVHLITTQSVRTPESPVPSEQ